MWRKLMMHAHWNSEMIFLAQRRYLRTYRAVHRDLRVGAAIPRAVRGRATAGRVLRAALCVRCARAGGAERTATSVRGVYVAHVVMTGD